MQTVNCGRRYLYLREETNFCVVTCKSFFLKCLLELFLQLTHARYNQEQNCFNASNPLWVKITYPSHVLCVLCYNIHKSGSQAQMTWESASQVQKVKNKKEQTFLTSHANISLQILTLSNWD